MGVDLGELRAQHVADPADGEVQALVAVEEGSGTRRDRIGRGGVRARQPPDQLHLERQLAGHQVAEPARSFEESPMRPGPGRVGGEDLAVERVGDGDGFDHGGVVRLRAWVPRRGGFGTGGMLSRSVSMGNLGRAHMLTLRESMPPDRVGPIEPGPTRHRPRTVARRPRPGWSGSRLPRSARRPLDGADGQVDRESLGDQPPQYGEERRDRLALAGAGGDGEVGPAFEDVADHPGAGGARADLDEGPDPVGVGPANHGGEVDPRAGRGRGSRRRPTPGSPRTARRSTRCRTGRPVGASSAGGGGRGTRVPRRGRPRNARCSPAATGGNARRPPRPAAARPRLGPPTTT